MKRLPVKHPVIIFAVYLLLMPLIAHAATEQRTALVIGNSAYSSGPLKNPVNDAEALAAQLQKLGFVVILKKNANIRGMEEALTDFGDRLKRGGVGLFFYAGHGLQVGGVNYLVPVGARVNRESDIKYETLDAGKVLDEMANANNALNIVILDACRDNPYSRSFRNAARGLAIVSNAPVGTFISYSTGPGNVARDGDGQNSPYTEALLRYIKEPGLSIEQVFKGVRARLGKETGGRQIPWELSSLQGDFYFTPQGGRQNNLSSAPFYTPQPESDELARQKAALEREREDLAREKQELERQKALDTEREQLAAERRKIEAEKQQLAMGPRPASTGSSTVGITYTDGRNIFKLSPLNGAPVNLTSYSSGTIGSQRVSPSGRKLAYSYNDGNGYGIYIFDMASGTKTKVASVSSAGYGIFVCWALDSRQIAYNDGNKLYKISVNGTDPVQFATAPSGRIFAGHDWSLSGNKIVALVKGSWAYNSEIYIMNSDGSGMTQIVPDKPGDMQPPAISPDGSKVIYSYDIAGYENSSGGSLDMRMFLINRDGTGSTDISTGKTNGTHDANPKWSPDGKKIIFTNAPWPSAGPTYIYQVNVTGTNRTQLTAGSAPDWF